LWVSLRIQVCVDATVAIAGTSDEVRATPDDPVETGADNASKRNAFTGQPPTEIFFESGDPTLAIQGADLGRHLLHKVLALFLQIAEGGGDKDAEFVHFREQIGNEE